MTSKFKSHPWHGIDLGEDAPHTVTAFIEIVPTDTVKYEVDKESGFLKIDRPQKFSNVVPALYGFLPQTFCGEKIARFAAGRSGRKVEKGDGDPLDILVLSEHAIPHGDVILQAIPIGGLRLIDKGEADDKIIAVMKADAVYSDWKDIHDIPESILNRLKHYFLTYKNLPGEPSTCEIAGVYGKDEAQKVIEISREDYNNSFRNA